MSNVISSIIFAHRNIDKTQNGDIGRAPVAAAQCLNVFNEAARYNKVLTKGSNVVTNSLTNLAQKSKTVDYAVKGVNWATKNVNTLIGISAFIKTLRSEDKLSTGITETCAITSMLIGEKLANKGLDALSKCNFKNPKIAKLFNKNSKIGAVVHGILFVCASIASYSAGEFVGKDLAKDTKIKLENKKNKINEVA